MIKHIELNFKGKAVTNKATGSCSYKTKNGKKCAVGLFIPEGHEGQGFDGDSYSLLYNYPDLKKKMPLNKRNLKALQHIHDHGYNILDNRTDEEVLCDLISFIESET